MYSNQELLRWLHISNPWWRTGSVPEDKAPEFKRRDFHHHREELQAETQDIMAIVGPRRVGKTTLLYQLIQNLIERGVQPERILYLSADDPALLPRESPLQEVLDVFCRNVLGEPVDQISDTCYAFLDEIHHTAQWQLYLKRWYDMGLNLKLIISGSSTTDIVRGGSSALVGRMSPRIMLPLKFLEVARFKIPEEDERLQNFCKKARAAFREGVELGRCEVFASALEKDIPDLFPCSDGVKIVLDQYLRFGGYPELLFLETKLERRRKLRDYIDLTIYKDVVRFFGIRNPRSMVELLTLLARESSQRFNVPNLADNLGIKSDTVRSYIDYLKDVFLVSESRHYSKSSYKPLRKDRKIVVRDPGICNTAAGRIIEEPFREDEVVRIAESVVNDHCRRLIFNTTRQMDPQVYYWRDPKTEVDIVIDIGGKPIPIEVKYQGDITHGNLRGIRSFSEEHHPPFSVMVTRDRFSFTGEVVYIPLWAFLMMC